MLSEKELERYSRQIMIEGFGQESQEKLKRSSVFVAGLGGLGSTIALFLAAAGVGRLKIADLDTIELSNLNRQILHWDRDLGRSKVESAAAKLREFNGDIAVQAVGQKISEENALELIGDCDVIVDALDNLAARYVLNQTSLKKKIPLCHGAIRGFEGRAMTIIPGKSACLMCIYQGAQASERSPAIGATAGLIACIEVSEVIKLITGLGRPLIDRFLIYDGLSMQFSEIRLVRNPACPHCGHLK
jgi:molybdopterin/thiamine biosynthesis adenylyltransferase